MLYKIGEIWWAQFRISGKRYYRSAKTSDKTLAKKIEHVKKSDIIRGQYSIMPDIKTKAPSGNNYDFSLSTGYFKPPSHSSVPITLPNRTCVTNIALCSSSAVTEPAPFVIERVPVASDKNSMP